MEGPHRNIFNQYKEPENRVTHGLAHAVASSPRLQEDFLCKLLGRTCPRGCTIEIQQPPVWAAGKSCAHEAGAETRPDIWICNEKAKFACIIENKLTAELSAKQLLGHLGQARKRGFEDITLVVITPSYADCPRAIQEVQKQHANVQWQKWPELHSYLFRWANEYQESWLIRQFCQFLQFMEEELIKEGKDMGGRLTEFAGIPFSKDEPYNYLQAKNLLRGLMQILFESHVFPNMYYLPPRIRDSGSQIWDIISLRPIADHRSFTNYPHITVVLEDDRIRFQLTLPDKAESPYWNALKKVESDRWHDVFSKILINVSKLTVSGDSPQPYLEVLQRHFSNPNQEGTTDAELFFALDTVVTNGKLNNGVKTLPIWKDHVQQLIQCRTKANIQLAVGVQYFYRDYPEKSSILRQAVFADEAKKALCALEPFYELLGL